MRSASLKPYESKEKGVGAALPTGAVARIVRVGLAALLATSCLAWAQVELRLVPPEHEIAIGETFEVPIYADMGEIDLASYALQLEFTGPALRVLDVLGGVVPSFAHEPVFSVARPVCASDCSMTFSTSATGQSCSTCASCG